MLTKVNYFASIFVTAPVKEQKVAGDNSCEQGQGAPAIPVIPVPTVQ